MTTASPARGGAVEILSVFLQLGVTSFGGPVAHLGYFRRELVERRGWLSEPDYAAILGLCQFLPGPASSQAGFCIGLLRGGWAGGLAAWMGFTLPSALLMFLVAAGAGAFSHSWLGRDVLHGLQLAAVAVVAQAVYTMARSLCPDTLRRVLAVFALVVVLIVPGTIGQILVLVIGGLTGRWFLEAAPAGVPDTPLRISRRDGALCVAAFFGLLAFALLVHGHGVVGLFDAFYRAGALVFGGGHVVLPLLHDAVVSPGWVSPRDFLTGYGAAQAMPGPLFTFAAYLGTIASAGPHGLAGAMIALVAIFLPGLLLVAGILPFWHELKRNAGIAAAVMGLNAAVVGLLGYALLNLIFLGAINGFFDLVIVVLAYLALTLRKTPPIAVVAACAAAAIIF
jgi:chromate transporter